MKDLLLKISEGQTFFVPENDDLVEFQRIVKELRRAYVHGYIGFFKVHQDATTGMYTKLVSGQLTPVGHRYLESLEQTLQMSHLLASSSNHVEQKCNV